MPSVVVLQQRLEEAELALHQLHTGAREVEVRVDDYGMTEFSEVNVKDLEHYIAKLRNEISMAEGRPRRRPILMRF